MKALRPAGAMMVALGVCLGAHPASAEDHPTLESADWQLQFDGQYKVRGQFDSGKNFTGDEAIDREWLSHRARLGVSAANKSGAKVVVRVQDVRVWGEETDAAGGGTQSNGAMGLDLHEAYAVIPLGMEGLALQAGRQEISLDNHRLVGNADWTMRARRFDAARVRYNLAPLDVSVFGAMLTERENADADGHVLGSLGDIYFGGLHGKYTLGEMAKVSLMYLARKNDSALATANELRQTAGLFAEGKVAGVSWTAEGYGQFGHVGAADLMATLIGVRAAYTVDLPQKPTVGLLFDDVSGDGNVAHAFDTLYATNHKFYGEMDFFLAFGKHTLNRGLRDIGATLSAVPVPGLTVGADFHIFATHALAGDALTAAKDVQPATDLGKEVDVRAIWKLRPGNNLHLLYGMFMPGDGMRSIKKIPDATALTTEHYCALTVDAAF